MIEILLIEIVSLFIVLGIVWFLNGYENRFIKFIPAILLTIVLIFMAVKLINPYDYNGFKNDGNAIEYMFVFIMTILPTLVGYSTAIIMDINRKKVSK